MFIFDRCHRISAAVAPVKYECDWNNLTGAFTRSEILLMEKLTNRALVTPPQHLPYFFQKCSPRKRIHCTGTNNNALNISQQKPSFTSKVWCLCWQWMFRGLRPVLEGFVVTMHEGICEQEVQSQGLGFGHIVCVSPSALWQQNPTKWS